MSILAEPFLDSAAVEATTGTLSYEVNRLTKDPGNPVATGVADSWDHHIVYTSACVVDGVMKRWDTTFTRTWTTDTGGRAFITYSESTDGGETWTRPNLGLVSYGGNTNNNIVMDAGVKTFGFVAYEPDALPATPYVLVCSYAATTTDITRRIYVSADGKNFTLAKNLGTWGPTARDLSSITWLPDQEKWLVAYQAYPTSERRSVGLMLSDTSSIGGTWTDLGTPTGLLSTSTADQFYLPNVWREGDVLLMAVCVFDNTNPFTYAVDSPPSSTENRQHKFELWAAREAAVTTWSLLDADWLWGGSTTPDNTPGEPDYGCVKNGGPFVRWGNTYVWLWSGSPDVHHPGGHGTDGQNYFNTPHQLFRGTLRVNGVGGITGTGTARTGLITAAISASLAINSVGTVEVELLDASNNVITGYSRADCDTIPADAFDHTVTWNGSRATPDEFKVKLYLTSATVHFLTAEEYVDYAEGYGNTTSTGYDDGAVTVYTPPTASIVVDPASPAWDQIDTQIVVRVTADAPSTVPVTFTSDAGSLVWFRGTDADLFEVSLDGTSWAPRLDVPAGETGGFLRVTPEAPGTTLTAEIGIA